MAVTEEQEILLLEPPFSFFDLVETRFGDYDSIRRIFSLARSFHAETLTIENLPPSGIIAEENEDILARYPDYRNVALLRLSFWERRYVIPTCQTSPVTRWPGMQSSNTM